MCRTRKVTDDTFAVIIVVPEERRFGLTIKNISAYVAQRVNGRYTIVPARLEVENG